MESIIFKAKPVNFNSRKVRADLKKIKKEIDKIMSAAKVDTSKLHITFNI